jgi:NADH:ubiquinone oxidoreductase subunit B-like Fe-S oxidoreductase
MDSLTNIKELIEWCQSRGLPVISVAVGDCKIELMPARAGGSIINREADVDSMYSAYGGELMDEATRQARSGGAEDLIPVVSQ